MSAVANLVGTQTEFEKFKLGKHSISKIKLAFELVV